MAIKYSTSLSLYDAKKQSATIRLPTQDQSSATYDGVNPYATVRASWESSAAAITECNIIKRTIRSQTEYVSSTVPTDNMARREAKLVHVFRNSTGDQVEVSTPGPDYDLVVFNGGGSDQVNIALTVAAGYPLDVFHTNTAKILNGDGLDDYAIAFVYDVGRNT